MIRSLLDTNICIYAIKGKIDQLAQKLQAYEPGQLGISVVTLAELQYGVQRSQAQARNQAALENFLLALEVVGYDASAALHFGRIRALLESKGTPIGPYDMLIASQAVALSATLVTNNLREYQRIPGLALENWAETK